MSSAVDPLIDCWILIIHQLDMSGPVLQLNKHPFKISSNLVNCDRLFSIIIICDINLIYSAKRDGQKGKNVF